MTFVLWRPSGCAAALSAPLLPTVLLVKKKNTDHHFMDWDKGQNQRVQATHVKRSCVAMNMDMKLSVKTRLRFHHFSGFLWNCSCLCAVMSTPDVTAVDIEGRIYRNVTSYLAHAAVQVEKRQSQSFDLDLTDVLLEPRDLSAGSAAISGLWTWCSPEWDKLTADAVLVRSDPETLSIQNVLHLSFKLLLS